MRYQIGTRLAAALLLAMVVGGAGAQQVPSKLDLQRACEAYFERCSLYNEPRLKRAAACRCYVDLVMSKYTNVEQLRDLHEHFFPDRIMRDLGRRFTIPGVTAEEMAVCRRIVPNQNMCSEKPIDEAYLHTRAELAERTEIPHPWDASITVLRCRYQESAKPLIERYYLQDKKDGKLYGRGENTLEQPLRAVLDCPRHPERLECKKNDVCRFVKE